MCFHPSFCFLVLNADPTCIVARKLGFPSLSLELQNMSLKGYRYIIFERLNNLLLTFEMFYTVKITTEVKEENLRDLEGEICTSKVFSFFLYSFDLFFRIILDDFG